MTYIMSWAWVGGPVPPSALDDIKEWVGPKGLESDVQPVIWVDEAAARSLRIAIQSQAVDLGGGVSTQSVVQLGSRSVPVVNIDARQGPGWSNNGGLFAQFNLPGWAQLAPAITAEATAPDGLKQVASDIVRVASLWLVGGGAYFDIDSKPGKRRLGERALREALSSSPLEVVPLVMHDPSGTWYRVENGVIITNPDPAKAVAARTRYAAILNAMAAKFGTGNARITAANASSQAWAATAVAQDLPARITHCQTRLNATPPPPPAVRARLTKHLEVLNYLAAHLPGATTPAALDQVLADAIGRRTQTDRRVSRLIHAMVTQNESQYRDRLADALGDFVADGMTQRMSGTVSAFTLSSFVETVRDQVRAQVTSETDYDKTLYVQGWKLCEPFTSRTQIDSWYSWKTRPGKLLIAAVANTVDQPVDQSDATLWPSKDDKTCSLCDDRVRNLHHCRRCGIVVCTPCATKADHAQPRGSTAARLWYGDHWVCRACALVLAERRQAA